MLIIWKFTKSAAGRTKDPRGPHVARVFETPDLILSYALNFLRLEHFPWILFESVQS